MKQTRKESKGKTKTSHTRQKDLSINHTKKTEATVQTLKETEGLEQNDHRYIITWSDDHISLNDWYSSKHWTVRNKQKEKWRKIFKTLWTYEKRFKKYTISLTYNSRLDPSNTITMIKLFEDFLVKQGVIIDDSKKYCRGIEITPDETLGKKEYIIEIIEA